MKKTKEENPLKYLDDLTISFSDYVSCLIHNVIDGISENIGVNPQSIPEPKNLQKAFLNKFRQKWRNATRVGRRKDYRKPFSVKGLKIYQQGKPLTEEEWNRIFNQLSQYLQPFLSGLSEEMAVKGTLLAMAAIEEELKGSTTDKHGKKSLKQIEQDRFKGYIPDTIKSFYQRYKTNKQIKKAVVNSYGRVAMYVNEVNDDIKAAIKQQVTTAHRLNLTPKELASNLYWMKDENPELKKYTAEKLRRDFQRTADTELATIYNNAKIGAYEDIAEKSFKGKGEGAYFLFMGGTCKECQKRHGTVARLIPLDMVGSENDDSLSGRGIHDEYTDIAIWRGKNNIGYKTAQWRLCVPLHPWNTAQMERFSPGEQEYDKRTGRIKGKVEKRFEKYIPKDFLEDINKNEAEALARKEKQEADREKGEHKRDIDYISYPESKEMGADSKGRKMVEVDGIAYMAVHPGDFNKELEQSRQDPFYPVPVASNQREYKQIFENRK